MTENEAPHDLESKVKIEKPQYYAKMFYATPTHTVNSTQLLPIFVDVKKCASRTDNNFLLLEHCS